MLKRRFFILMSFFAIAISAIAQTDYEKYIDAANNGDAKAQYNIGLCYVFGNGVSKNKKKAVTWIMNAAEQDYSDAQNALGDYYYNGFGVKRDFEKAFYWYKRAADLGDPLGLNNVGMCYYRGIGVNENSQKALEFLKKSAEKKNISAIMNLEKIFGIKLPNNNMQQSNIAQQHNAVQQNQTQNMSTKQVVHTPSSPVDLNIPVTDKENNNTFAIVIGNEKYKNVAEVPFAVNDAKIFSEYLEKTLGVPREQIKLIENAGYNDIRIAMNWLNQAMNVSDGKGKAIVYYAGHGIPNETDNSSYLLPVDGIGNDPSSAYSLKDLYDKLSKMQAQTVTVFLDACFSGTKRENGMLVAARGVAIKVKPSAPKGKMVVFSAAQGDETAYPYQDMQHGMFTYFLLKKLQETKGDVTLGELGDYLKSEVKRQSFLKNNKIQTPMTSVATALQNQWKSIKLK